MKIIKIINRILICLTLLLLSACSDFTDGINVDPNNFTDVPGNLLIGQANLAAVKLSESNASRIAGIWTDQFTGSDRQYIPLNNYTTIAADFDDEWDDMYADGLAQARLAELKGAEAGDDLLIGVSKIIQGLLIGESASLWGNIPYVQALDYNSFPNPIYDDQLSVLQAAQDLLSEGISIVGDAKVADVYGAPIYVDNNAKWSEVAHTLKARFYLVMKNYQLAYDEAKLGISSTDANFLASHNTAVGSQNLYYQFTVDQREGYLDVANSHMRKLLDGTSTRLLNTPGDANRITNYFNGTVLNTNEGGYFAQDADFPIASFIETKLIEAEAAQRIGQDALTPFNEVRAELAVIYGGSFPSTTSTGNDLLLEILEEKYLSLPGALTVFHDVRRTNNAIGIPIKNTTQGNTTIPQRFLYPQIEINSNDNFPGLIDLFTPTPVNQ